MQSNIKQSILLGVGLVAIAGVAQAELTANVGATTNYVFRGETQTDDNIAIQGGVDYTHEFEHDGSLYVGAWASNVETPTGDKGFETDFYAGYNFKLNESVSFDVGYITYQYSSVNLADIDEVFFGAAFKDVSLTYYAGNTDGPGNTDYSYIDLKYSFALPKDYNVHLHYGNYDPDSGTGAEDVSIGVSKMLIGIDFSLTATSIDRDNNTDDTNVFITGVKTFDFL